jgi:hypothetical protein
MNEKVTAMKRTATVVAGLLAPLLLAACTTPTPYQPLASGTAVSGGYSDQMLDDTHFRVSFSGNDMTPRQQVETYLLYRAAELTAAKGFDWFEMADRQTDDKSQTFVDPGPWGYWSPSWRFHRHGGWYGGFGWGDPWGPDIDTIDQFNATAEVVVGHGPKPANDPRAFDAHAVLQNLAPQIVRPGQSPPAH